jgi:tRNA threonylcarbamoyl adenosine modification protein YeaZ
MKTQNNLVLAIDCAYARGMLTAISPNGIVAERALSNKMQHASGIGDGIREILEILDKEGLSLGCVMVGLGPGSFIGVRIALATAMGFCFGRSLPLMGFCSHAALAYSIPDSHFGLRAVLMKASGPWCYLSLYEMKSGRLCPRIDTQEITKEEALKIVPKNALLISDILFSKEDLAANEIQLVNMEGPTARGIELAVHGRLEELSIFPPAVVPRLDRGIQQ